MDLQQCWTHYLKAEQLLEQGHWPEAHYLFEQVLDHLPTHIQSAIDCEETKPCQFSCLLAGFKNVVITQSEILNKIGQHQQAFDLLNRSYALIQFVSIEPSDLVEATHPILENTSEELLRHIGAFCTAQRNAQWMIEFDQIQRAHHHFATLKNLSGGPDNSRVIN